MNKLTLSDFLITKQEFQKIIDEAIQEDSESKANPNYNQEEILEKFLTKHFNIQDNLLSFDLSDIPFEAWEGVRLFGLSGHSLDFSKTHANIDFSQLEITYDDDAIINFANCQVKNIAKLGGYKPEYFDSATISANPNLFLDSSFSPEFQKKYYNNSLTLDDLSLLSEEELAKLNNMRIFVKGYSLGASSLSMLFSLERSVNIYKYSKELLPLIDFVIENSRNINIDWSNLSIAENEFTKLLKEAPISELKNICYDYITRWLSNQDTIEISKLPSLYIQDNAELFLLDQNIPEDLRNRYYQHNLTISDVLNNPNVFDNIDIGKFMSYYKNRHNKEFIDSLGPFGFQTILKKHPDTVSYILDYNLSHKINIHLHNYLPLEEKFTKAVKMLILEDTHGFNIRTVLGYDTVVFNVPDWLKSMNFDFKDGINTIDDLMQYHDLTIPLGYDINKSLIQTRAVDLLNPNNIKKFEQETGFFSYKKSQLSLDIEMFNALAAFISKNKSKDFDFQNGTLTYDEFQDEMAKCLNSMRKNNVFTDYLDYGWMQGPFRSNHSDIFIDSNSPDFLQKAFYQNKINLDYLFYHQEYYQYFLNFDLKNIINANIKLLSVGFETPNGYRIPNTTDFIEEYTSRYGNEKFLRLVSQYGKALNNLSINSLKGEIEDENAIEENIQKAIYSKIIKEHPPYDFLQKNSDFVSKYPEIFLDYEDLANIPKNAHDDLIFKFYSGRLSPRDIAKYPELIDILKNKNLSSAFFFGDVEATQGTIFHVIQRNDGNKDLYSAYYEKIITKFGNENFLKICSEYGSYYEAIIKYLNSYKRSTSSESFEEYSKELEIILTQGILAGDISYSENAPEFLHLQHPELFLAENAPDSLKIYFYSYFNNHLNFKTLQGNKTEWLPYLQGKNLKPALIRGSIYSGNKENLKKYFNLFGEEKALKLGLNKGETVDKMIAANKVELMKTWYDKTGQRFIPDYVVMQNFPESEIDKFLTSGTNWSSLMRIERFANIPEGRDALLKLAYTFGAFDNDQRGFKQLSNLLTTLPHRIDPNQSELFKQIDYQIDLYSNRSNIFNDTNNTNSLEQNITEMLDYAKSQNVSDLVDSQSLVKLITAIKRENVNIDFSKPIFQQIYRQNEDGSFTLTINPEKYPKTCQIVRGIIEKEPSLNLLSPRVAHNYLGNFKLTYNPNFRDFFIKNYQEIMSDSKYLKNIATIQRRFEEISTVYHNIPLTIELANSYVQENRYEKVDVGNEVVTPIAAICNYSQMDFEIIQRIFNYGKQRIYSSIPRITGSQEVTYAGTNETYTYEMLRLDDPHAMSIGKESDCCQVLGNAAEVCMEHSMVDKNGRVFIIKDSQGNLVAQSWVWRNGNVLCFDNIEVPDQQMWDHGFKRGEEDTGNRNEFTDNILAIYQQAAHDLIAQDEKVYQELLDQGKITLEQFQKLKLSKITSGEGYSNIKGSLVAKTPAEYGSLVRPLFFQEPVKLRNSLYTNDSGTTQYVLAQNNGHQNNLGETLPVHSDHFTIYDDSNFTSTLHQTLKRLEMATKPNAYYLDTQTKNEEQIVSEIARNYGLSSQNTHIIINPNFAIIYEEEGNTIKIADLFYNFTISNNNQPLDITNVTIMQLRLALNQIGEGKTIDISSLDDKEQEVYQKALELNEELDTERGVNHAR